MPRRFVYLIRHGQYDHDHTVEDELGGTLTDLGREQAEYTAEALHYLPVTAIYSSTMHRAADTATIIAANFPTIDVQPTEDLWECIPTMPPRFAPYFANRADVTSESTTSCQARFDAVFERYFVTAQAEDQHDILVCHGNIIRYLVCKAMAIDAHSWASFLMHHCGISRVVIEADGQLFVISHNDIGHLPPDLRTET